MPVIKRQAPLLEEGEYAGQARRVGMDWIDPKSNPDGSKPPPVCRFSIPLHTHNGKQITAFIRTLEQTMWIFDQLCKSGEMTPPDGEEFQLTVDDLENRVFFFGVVHNKLPDGRTVANVKFHSRAYAIQQNPALANVSFPNAAPPITLRAAPPSAPPAPPEAGSTAKVTPPPTAPPVNEEKAVPTDPDEISEEDLAEAMAVARRIRAEKAAQSAPKT